MMFKVDFALKLSNYTICIIITFYMSQMNPKEFRHNTTYSVQLPYIAGHALPLNHQTLAT